MDVFVGAEYIIANALIALGKNGIDQIKLSTLQSFSIELQRLCVENSIDAVFLFSADRVSAAVCNFSEYFTFIDNTEEPAIGLNPTAKTENLEKRFIGYLPIALLKIIINTAQELKAA